MNTATPATPIRAYPFSLIARTALKVHCGCAAHFTTIEAGEKHARETGHTLHITGEIRPFRTS